MMPFSPSWPGLSGPPMNSVVQVFRSGAVETSRLTGHAWVARTSRAMTMLGYVFDV